ncbi:MAG: hypothetical protein H0W62_01810 [Chitinophagales bacterium]|nr:hypothetical protein [Chitinophagales bacterium]
MKTETKGTPTITNGHIGVLVGSVSDLSSIDFSPWGCKCFHINSSKFQEYIHLYSKDSDWYELTWRNINSACNESADGDKDFLGKDNLNVLVPLSLETLPSEEDIHDIRLALLLIFPSEISVKNIINIQVYDHKYIHSNSYSIIPFHPIGEMENMYINFINIQYLQIDEVNIFLKLYKERKPKLKYVQLALSFYESSWRVQSYDYTLSFVSLCIALEGIVQGSEQVSYKLRRNIAVLCGGKYDQSVLILGNVKKIYDTRSDIVHSNVDRNPYARLNQYYDYTKAIVSRMIIEMILHNLSDLKTLDTRLGELGFGDKAKISSDYTECVPNQKLMEAVVSTSLK